MSVTWKYVKPLTNKSTVKEYLKSNHISLPNNLVGILEKNNGGRPSEKSVITDTKREYVFKSLVSFNDSDKESITKYYSNFFKERDLFPIGSDAAGNFICYNVKTKKYVLYNHETDKTEIITKMPF